MRWGGATESAAARINAIGRVFYGQGNDFNNLSGKNAGALGFLDAILSSLETHVSCRNWRGQQRARAVWFK